MEFRQLQALLAVADTASFTKAADDLFLSQSAVTRQIAALELETKTRLFDRMGRQVVLTSAGMVLEKYARAMVRMHFEAKQALEDVAAGNAGRLSLGSSSTAAAYLLPKLLQRFRAIHPSVELSVFTGPSGHVEEMVAANQVDIGLVMDTPEIDHVRSIKLSEYTIALIVYPGHPLLADDRSEEQAVTLDKLSELPLILMQPGASLRKSADKMLGETVYNLTVSMEMDNVEAIKKMIEAKLGVSLLPTISVRSETESGTLIALPIQSPNPPTQAIGIIHRDDKYVTKAMQSFIEVASDVLSVTV